MKPLITILLLLCITTAYAGERRNIKTYDTGRIDRYGNAIVEHYTLLDSGECNENTCVIYEHTTQGGLLYQWHDTNDDNICDRIIVWKSLIDPTWGTYYSLHATKKCGGSI